MVELPPFTVNGDHPGSDELGVGGQPELWAVAVVRKV